MELLLPEFCGEATSLLHLLHEEFHQSHSQVRLWGEM